ncbi:lipid A export permease/ATP-binding protein MsbA [Burkholderiaceae bacterium DAT-1]|nr:lipid A export permease/ATP-binding protein MsbA [Burkholderiaceae bacterium DAT-1]
MNTRDLYLRILGYFRPYAGIATGTTLAVAIASATDVLLVKQLGTVIDAFDSSRLMPNAVSTASSLDWLSHWLVLDPRQAALWSIPAVIFFLTCIRMLASFSGEYGSAWLQSRVQHDLRDQLFRHVLTLPNRYFDNTSTGLTLSKIAFDVNQMSQAGLNVLNTVIKDGVAVIGYLAVMLNKDWQLMMLVLILAPCVGLIVNVAGKRLRKLGHDAQSSFGEMTRVLDEIIGGQRVVKIFGGQRYEADRFNTVANRVRSLTVKQASTAAINSGLIMLLIGAVLSIIIYFALSRARQGHLSPGDFVAFMGALLAIQGPVKSLTKLNEPLQKGLAAAESAFDLLKVSGEVDTGKTTILRTRGELLFDAIAFHYTPDIEDSRPALKQVSLAIPAGETVALVGASGSGKTTIANLLPRFYDPSAGRILLDGIDIRDMPLSDLRRQIALVSQDVVLFNDTIAANIAYGDPAPDLDKVITAGKAAFAHEFIERMPDGYHTLIGENGTRLSGGQRQRLAIARAIYKDAPLLILDEATSALDTESERQVQAALDILMKGRTTLVIAHRLSTIEQADRIVVMQSGEIIESGNHASLLQTGGAYADLYNLQFRSKDAG